MKKKDPTTKKQLLAEIEELKARLAESEDTLRAIHNSEVDGLLINSQDIEKIFTIQGADHAYRVLFETMNEGALILMVEGMILYANHRFADMLKLPLEKVVGSSFYDWIAPESKGIIEELFQKKGDPRTRLEVTLLASDETQVQVYLSASQLLIDGLSHSICLIVTDLTEQKLREKSILASKKVIEDLLLTSEQSRRALLSLIEDERQAKKARRESEERLQVFLDIAPIGITITDERGNIIDCNKASEKLLGITKAEHLSRNYAGKEWAIFHPDGHPMKPEEFASVRALNENRLITEQVMEVRTPQGSVWLSVSATPLHIPGYGVIVTYADITERKLVEKTLFESETQLRTIFNESPVGIALIDSLTGYIYEVNPKFAQIAGRTIEQMANIDWMSITHPDDVQEDLDNMALLNAGKIHGFQMEKRYLHPDGKAVWINMIIAPLTVEDKTHPRHICMIEDITERRQAIDELKQIEWLLEPKDFSQSRFVPTYGDVTKYNTERTILNALGPDTIKNIVNEIMGLLETSSAVYEKNGDYAAGIFSSGWCQFMDQASFKLCNTSDPVQALNSGNWHCHESCWKEASKVSIETGLPNDIECAGGIHLYAIPIRVGNEIIGSINFGYGDPPKNPEKLNEIAAKYKVDVADLVMLSNQYKKRPQFIIDLAKYRLKEAANFIGLLVGRKRAEEEIHRLNAELEHRVADRTLQLEFANRQLLAANAELEAFSYTVSHDLRAPLRHIDGFVDLLVSRFGESLGEKGRHYIETIADSARQMGVLIDALLQFSRTGRSEMHQGIVDMNKALNEALTLIVESNTGLNIEWIIGDIPAIRGDFALLRQVWVNLVENAVKYSLKKDFIKIEIHSREEKDEIIFSVKDNGVGFDMHYASNLFGVFQRLHSVEEFEGIGIGLATVKRIISRHGGRIWAEAKINEGATFHFALPKLKEGKNA